MSSNSPRLDNEKVATILVEALFFGDTRTAEKWGIHKQTVKNYRKRLHNDTNGLVPIFKHKKNLFENDWAAEMPVTLRMALDFIQRASQKIDYSPEAVHAMAGAYKIVADIALTKDMIDVKLEELGYYREKGKLLRQVAYPEIPANTE